MASTAIFNIAQARPSAETSLEESPDTRNHPKPAINGHSKLLFFLNLDYRPPAVEPAFRANAVRQPLLAAIRAGAKRGSRQMIMRPALAGA
jgi:hypothetical protein